MTATLQNSSVLVAGASGGIGRSVAAELHRRGAVLTMVARRAEPLDEIDLPGARMAVDLRSPEGCAAAIDRAVDHAGGLDVVVNAVGVVAFGPGDELSVDALEELFLTNLFLPVMLSQAAALRLRTGGAIVHFSGVIAERNLPGMAAYGASKAALRSFDEAVGREYRRRNLRVIDARPPHTETGLADRPIEGSAPRLRPGLSPDLVAARVCDALEQGDTDLPSTAFTAD